MAMGGLLAVIAGAAYHWTTRGPLPPQFVTAPVTRGAVAVALTATGTVNPETVVEVAAEAQLHAASAAIGVATAQLYPSITLSASVALETIATNGTFSGPIIASSLAAGLTAPLFHGGTLLAQRRAAIDAYAAQLAGYRQTVLLAFGQVADVLQALQHDAELLGAENTAVTTSDASLKLAQDAYAAGRGSLLQVLDAQRLYEQALLGYARAKGQRYLDTILLFEAMGGTWRDWVASVHR